MEDRIKRGRQRLHHVVEHMRGAERDQDANRRRLHPPTARRGGISVSLRSRQGSVPGPRVSTGRRPKKSGRQKRPYVRYAAIMSAPASHCQFGGGYFLSETFKKA